MKLRCSEVYADAQVKLSLPTLPMGKLSCSQRDNKKCPTEQLSIFCIRPRSKLSLGVLATPFDIVNIVKYRVISCIYRVFSCDIVNIVSIV